MSLNSHRYRVVGVVGITAGGLALALTSAASGATPSPSPSATSTTSGAPAAPPNGGPAAGPHRPGKGGLPGPAGPGGPGGPGPAGGPAAGGLVTSISSSALTVKDDFGTSATYVLTSSTKYQAGPQKSISRSDIKAGDRVIVRPTTAGGKTAAEVDERLPHIGGIVVSVSGSTITVKDADGFTRTIMTSASTTYTKAGKTVAASSITGGTPVDAEGTVDSNGTTLDASSVDVRTKPVAPAAGTKAPAAPAAGATPPAVPSPAASAPTGS